MYGGRAFTGQGRGQNTAYAVHTNIDDQHTLDAEKTEGTPVIPKLSTE